MLTMEPRVPVDELRELVEQWRNTNDLGNPMLREALDSCADELEDLLDDAGESR